MEIQQERLTTSALLHRQGGMRGFSCTPKLSSIDKRWFAEMNQVVLDENGRYAYTKFNLKLGTGDTPLQAAADGYCQVMPDDETMRHLKLLVGLEVLLPALNRRADAMKKLEDTLAGLTSGLRSVNVPRAAAPGEDDDL